MFVGRCAQTDHNLHNNTTASDMLSPQNISTQTLRTRCLMVCASAILIHDTQVHTYLGKSFFFIMCSCVNSYTDAVRENELRQKVISQQIQMICYTQLHPCTYIPESSNVLIVLLPTDSTELLLRWWSVELGEEIKGDDGILLSMGLIEEDTALSTVVGCGSTEAAVDRFTVKRNYGC